jgi:hypothetical protein
MVHKHERSLESLTNDSTRQRWELFHRAIASAKRSNKDAMRQAENAQQEADPAPETEPGQRKDPPLSIAR